MRNNGVLSSDSAKYTDLYFCDGAERPLPGFFLYPEQDFCLFVCLMVLLC